MDEVAQQLLMAHLTGGASIGEIVAQVAADDPATAQVLAALQQRDAASDDDDAEDDLELEFDAEAADVMQRLYAEVECLRERNERLADALGACPRCFGEDETCRVCAGRGRPGGRRPDPDLFAELVAPAVERARPALTPTAFSDGA